MYYHRAVRTVMAFDLWEVQTRFEISTSLNDPIYFLAALNKYFDRWYYTSVLWGVEYSTLAKSDMSHAAYTLEGFNLDQLYKELNDRMDYFMVLRLCSDQVLHARLRRDGVLFLSNAEVSIRF